MQQAEHQDGVKMDVIEETRSSLSLLSGDRIPPPSRSIEIRLFDHAKGFPTNYRQKILLPCELGASICLTALAKTFSLSGGCTVRVS